MRQDDEQKKQDDLISVSLKLTGEDAERFVAYMEREKIKMNSVAARKLILERLDQLEGRAA